MILVRLKGGLGNQLFQYASARTIADKLNTELKIDLSLLGNQSENTKDFILRDYELHAYNIRASFATKKEIERYNPSAGNIFSKIARKFNTLLGKYKVYIQPDHSFDNNILTISNNTCLVGSFQSEKFFEHNKTKITDDIQLKKNISQKEKSLIDSASQNVSVAVHVRRGDYISVKTYSELLGTKDNSYFEEAFSYLKNKLNEESLKIFIFSDDITWCKTNLKFETDTIYVDAESYSEDHHLQIELMRNCKHFIISNSTFSWWGAWLSSNKNKIIIAPKIWFNDATVSDKDIVPTNWLRI